MRQRQTYLLHDPQAFGTSQVVFRNDFVNVTALHAAKETRLSFGSSELPQELWGVLKQCHELHIRWASTQAYTSVAPFVSRVPPGLHIFFTPLRDRPADGLCPLIRKVFGEDLKCQSPKETFISQRVLSERFSTTSASQYYQLLPSLRDLVIYIQQKVCPVSGPACQDEAASLLSASYLDIDFDAISQDLVLSVYWDRAPTGDGWTEMVQQRHDSDTVEVGVLSNESLWKNDEPENLRLAGSTMVLGQKHEPDTVNFAFPSRHHPLPSTSQTTYTAAFKQLTGLHPTLQLTFPRSALVPPAPTCALHAYLTLPSYLFIDRYQLSDPPLLSSHHLRHLHSLSGEADLEAPSWVLPKWGSAALFELAHPPSSSSPSAPHEPTYPITIPLHLRYLPPNNTSGLAALPLPWPAVFWACPAAEGAKASTNPFDRQQLGFDGLFGARTLFHHVPPAPAPAGAGAGAALVLVLGVQAPALDLRRAGWVRAGTGAAVLAGALWVLWRLVVVARAAGGERRRGGGRGGDGRR